MALLSREQFLKSRKLQTIEVDLPELGGSARVQQFSTRTKSELEKRYLGGSRDPKDDPGRFRIALLQLTLIDDAGELMFSSTKEAELLYEMPADDVEKLFEASCELNGFTNKDVEVSEKNSEATKTAS